MRSKIQTFIILLASVLTLTINLTQASEIDSNFIIEGCISQNGEYALAQNTCSADGKYFCSQGNILQDTIKEDRACDTGGGSQCCPAGYECGDKDNNGETTCELSTEDCGQYNTDQDGTECENNGCFWIADPDAGFCVSRPLDYSCAVYKDSGPCNADVWNLGQEGFGTEPCNEYFEDGSGESFVAPHKKCSCEWDDDEKCKLTYTVQEEIYAEAVGNPDSFKCSKEFTSGPCNEGSQLVSWIAKIGIGSFIPDATLKKDSKCEEGTQERACGEPTIKLPAFSFFALITSITLIGLFYIFRKDQRE